jgi:hypothetical protein
MKATFHKSCNCKQCRAGRDHEDRNTNERKLRRFTREKITKFLKGENDDVLIFPISSPYTD